MDELKQARERRASSARRAPEEPGGQAGAFREQYEDWREERDDRPFWERDDPFGSDGYTPRGRAAGDEAEEEPAPRYREKYEQYEEERPMRSKPNTQTARGGARGRRQESAAGRGGERHRQSAEGARRKPVTEDRWNTAELARQHARSAPAPKSHAGLYMLLLLLGLISLAIVIGLKVFEVTTIDVTGNDTMTADSVIALSGISKGENIFKVNLGQMKKNLESDPLIEVLGITRIFPDKLRIEIRQRAPHGAIAYLGTYAVIDEKGFVLDEKPELPAGQYPLVTGFEIEPPTKGAPVAGVDGTVLDTMHRLLKALYDKNAICFVSEVNLSQPNDIKLLTAEGLRIDIGKPADLDKKAQWIASSVPELRTKGMTAGVLYVTGAGSPVYSAAGGGQGQ